MLILVNVVCERPLAMCTHSILWHCCVRFRMGSWVSKLGFKILTQTLYVGTPCGGALVAFDAALGWEQPQWKIPLENITP